MKDIVSDPSLVAYCGLYCGACPAHLKEKCPGCHGNDKASWCQVRTCCAGKGISSCADCEEFPNPKDCKKFHNFMSKLLGFFFRSDRAACIQQIRELGIQGHADDMSGQKRHAIKK